MEETKKCPYCGEEILAAAKKCKHCGEWFDGDSASTSGNSSPKDESPAKLPQPPKEKNVLHKILTFVGVTLAILALIGKCAPSIKEMLGLKTVKVMSVTGMYQYQEDYTERVDEDDSYISKFTMKGESIDEFKEDGTETDNGPRNYIFEVEDDDGYSNVITLSYILSYTGTWEQKGLNLHLIGEKFNMTFVRSATKYNRSDDNFYIQQLKEMMEDIVIPGMKGMLLGKRELKIKSLTRERMVTIEDDEETIYTRID